MTTLTDRQRIAPNAPTPAIPAAKDSRIEAIAARVARIDVMLVLLFVTGVGMVVWGCAKNAGVELMQAHNATGDHIAEATVLNEMATGAVEKVERKTTGEVKQTAGFAITALVRQMASLTQAKQSHADEAKAAAKAIGDLTRQRDDLGAKYQKLYGSIGARAERFVRKVIFWLLAWVFVAIGLRLVGQLAVGPLGAIASAVSTFMLGPLAWIQAGFDNSWFRRIRPAVVEGAK